MSDFVVTLGDDKIVVNVAQRRVAQFEHTYLPPKGRKHADGSVTYIWRRTWGNQ